MRICIRQMLGSTLTGRLGRLYTESKVLELIALTAGINTTKLKKGFRDLFGITIFSYIRAQRMESALRLIQEGDCTVCEAASRVGYRSTSAFTRAFEAEYGIPPGSLRTSEIRTGKGPSRISTTHRESRHNQTSQ